jgi:serine protease Do
MRVMVTVGELEKAEENGFIGEPGTITRANGTEIEPLGINIDPLESINRDDYAIPEDLQNGVVVTSVDPESQAAAKGIIVGDVIVEINQAEINNAKDVEAVIKEAKDKDRSSVLLLINRDSDVRFIALKIEDESKGEDEDE